MSDAPKQITDLRESVEHLNRVVSLMLPTFAPQYNAIDAAALFLLRAHREHGTQIRVSVYDYAISLSEKVVDEKEPVTNG